MKAEDTVISEKDIWDIQFKVIEEFKKQGKLPSTYELDKPVAQAQAEISFKAGIKEVAEWIEGKDHPVNISHIHIVKIEWQAKLKEWGIE